MTDREKMAREIGFAAWLDEQRQNFDEAEIEDERHATMRGENDHWSEIKAALLAYNKGRADMREEATAPKNVEIDIWISEDEGPGWRKTGCVAGAPPYAILDEDGCFYHPHENGGWATHWRLMPDPPAAIRAISVGESNHD